MKKTDKQKYLNEEEFVKFLKAIKDDTDYILFFIMGNLGLRVGEGIRLRIEDIDWKGKYIKIPTLKQGIKKDSKKGSLPYGKLPETYIDIPLDKIMIIIIGQYILNKKIKSGWLFPYREAHIPKWLVQRKFKGYVKKAGLDSIYSVHSLRHYKGVQIYSQLKDIRAVQVLLRHKNINSSTVYTTMDLDKKRDLIKGLEVIK